MEVGVLLCVYFAHYHRLGKERQNNPHQLSATSQYHFTSSHVVTLMWSVTMTCHPPRSPSGSMEQEGGPWRVGDFVPSGTGCSEIHVSEHCLSSSYQFKLIKQGKFCYCFLINSSISEVSFITYVLGTETREKGQTHDHPCLLGMEPQDGCDSTSCRGTQCFTSWCGVHRGLRWLFSHPLLPPSFFRT